LPDKAEIDLLEEDASQLDMADEDMDKLFPLDSMDDPNGKDDDNL
jgi:hypothetical protein